MRRLPQQALAAAALSLGLAACGIGEGVRETLGVGETAEAPTRCPRVAIAGEAAELISFRAGGSTASDVVYGLQMSNATVACDRKEGGLNTRLGFYVRAVAGPAARQPDHEVQYFVAVTDGADNVLSQRFFDLELDFSEAARLQFVEETGEIDSRDAAGAGPNWSILVGWRLTERQREFNRARRGL